LFDVLNRQYGTISIGVSWNDNLDLEQRMTSHLVTLFEHNRWANATILEFCAGLDDTVLDASTIGGFGTIRETLRHVVNSEAVYLAVLTSPRPDEHRPDMNRIPLIQELAEFNAAVGARLINCAREIPADRVLEGVRRGEEYRIPASVIFVQVINHATEHRTQIAAILTQQGIEPPSLDGWTYLDDVLGPQGGSE
jgi:uncharacterized damage-inducible protein DinB